jgi:hypothetical protein
MVIKLLLSFLCPGRQGTKLRSCTLESREQAFYSSSAVYSDKCRFVSNLVNWSFEGRTRGNLQPRQLVAYTVAVIASKYTSQIMMAIAYGTSRPIRLWALCHTVLSSPWIHGRLLSWFIAKRIRSFFNYPMKNSQHHDGVGRLDISRSSISVLPF